MKIQDQKQSIGIDLQKNNKEGIWKLKNHRK